MNAKLGIPVSEGKINLGEAVPLPAPFLIWMEPSRFCNIKCKFCPNPKMDNSTKSFMPDKIFERILSDIKGLAATPKVVRFCGVGESLMHPKIVDMIKAVHDNKAAENILMYTNGTLLKPELNRKIVDAGLTKIYISVNALNDDDYFDITGVRINFENYVNNIRDLYENRKQLKIYVKINHLAVPTKEQQQLFYDTFGDISDNINIEGISHIFPEFYSFGERRGMVRYHNDESKKYQICATCFKTLNINCDGTVSPCTVDWAHKVIVGDIKEESLNDIWNGEKLRQLHKRFCLGTIGKDEACYDCEDYFVSDHENIDAYAEEILRRL
ncbi:MAG: radical SAM protein [Ruminococcus sp.]|jgi:radical SAM protein with 4Fe4S-binding SPASM domain|nr:radical SAM protein [Ruminococcus sp.]